MARAWRVHGACMARARHVHGMRTACARHVHGMCTACAPAVVPRVLRIALGLQRRLRGERGVEQRLQPRDARRLVAHLAAPFAAVRRRRLQERGARRGRGAAVGNLPLEPRDLGLQREARAGGALVDDGAVLDELRALRKVERRDCLRAAALERRHARHDACARVAAQAVLEQHRQLGVAVRHVRLGTADQGRDAVAEGGEALVDVARL
eukprot:scaffold79085_cov66-Phaeocystis_antarctica.AAC.4